MTAHDRGRQDADGLLERGHFGVVLGDGDDQLVCLDDDVPEAPRKARWSVHRSARPPLSFRVDSLPLKVRLASRHTVVVELPASLVAAATAASSSLKLTLPSEMRL